MRKRILTLGLAMMLTVGALPLTDVSAASLAPLSLSPSRAGESTVSPAAIIATAMRYLGYPYTTVGNSPSEGFSCIGFVSYVYQVNGVPLPDDLWDAIAYAPQIPMSELQPGDVLFFQNTVWTGLSHTAIYLGDGRFIHAAWYNTGVIISSLTNDPTYGDYWSTKYLGANRPWGGAPVAASPAAPVPSDAGPPSPVPALRRGPHARVQVAGLNIRLRPSLESPVQDLAGQGTSLVVLRQYRNWYWVQLPDTAYGWVYATGIGKPLVHIVSTGRVQVDGLRVHTGPSILAPVAGVTGQGQHLDILGGWGPWLKVLLPDGTRGWVHRSFVGHAPAHHAQIRRGVVKSRPGQALGAGWTARVSMNVRSGPSLGHAVLTILPTGGWYRVLSLKGGWARVTLSDGTTGYVARSLLAQRFRGSLRAQASGIAAASPTRSVLTAGVRVHARPGLKTSVTGLAASGAHVQVLQRWNGWAQVRLPGHVTGWVYGTYVRAPRLTT